MIEIVKCFGKQKFQTVIFPADLITLMCSDFTANTDPVNIGEKVSQTNHLWHPWKYFWIVMHYKKVWYHL